VNEMRRDETLREIFRAAMTSETGAADSAQDHPVDDDELLIDWSVGDLDATRHRAVLDHLAECSYCRRELADMIQAGALVLPEHEDTGDPDDVREPAVTVRHDRSNASPMRNLALAATAIAASLLVAIIWGLSDRAGDSMLAMARRDLDAGRHTAAMERMEKYLDENEGLAADDHVEAGRILEESGYQLARKGLESGNFKNVLDIEGRTTLHSAVSPRLANLRIQAERGVTSEQTLATKGTLTDYDYELDGRQYAKGFPSFDATTTRLEKELAETVEKYPDSLDLRLNFGQFLMEQNDFERAVQQFTAAVRLDANSTLAQTGLGLALFQQDTDETIDQALGHFQKAVELSPNDLTANLNMAVCLARLGQKEKARPYFQKAQTLTDDEDTKKRIEGILK